MEDAAASAEHGTLHLMDVGAPVLGLGWGWDRGLREVSPPLPRGELLGRTGGAGRPPTLQKVILQWQELSCVFRMSTSP